MGKGGNRAESVPDAGVCCLHDYTMRQVHSQLSHLRCLALAKAELLQEQVPSLCLLPDVVELDNLLHRPSGDL